MTDAERYRLILNSRIAQINFELDKIYSGAEFQLVNAVINSDITDYDLQKNPALKKRIEDIINKLSAVTTRIVIAGAESSWALSNKKNDDMVHKIFKGKKEIPAHYLTQTNPQNDKAFSAFIDRKTNGLNLSENVWKYNEGYKTQIENALQVGIGNGVSANEMSKYLTQYLQNPTATIAEYDDKNISAQIPQSKKAQPGVYASPKKNAMRLARTEINMAYDTADYNRWQQLDFVVGFEVHTSGNHTTKDKKGKIIKIVDICDKLAGKYPKDFKFTGWHPQCRCYMTSILKSDEEQDDEDLAILRGEESEKKESENAIKDVPEGFKQWVSENKERLEKSDSLPYFVRDNKEYFSEVDFKSVVKDQFEESKPQEIVIQKTAKEITLENAKKRHDARTPEQIADIKKRWAEHEKNIERIKLLELSKNNPKEYYEQLKKKYDFAQGFIASDDGNQNPQYAHILPKSNEQYAEQYSKEFGISLERAKSIVESIYDFTYQWDYDIRAVQDETFVSSKRNHNISDIIQKGIDLEYFISKSPKWQGITYRGIQVTSSVLQIIKQNGSMGILDMKGTSSWSSSLDIGIKFALRDLKENYIPIVFKCNTPNLGTSIKYMSKYITEDEVLCSKYARYTITNLYPQMTKDWYNKGMNGMTEIIYIEVEENLSLKKRY